MTAAVRVVSGFAALFRGVQAFFAALDAQRVADALEPTGTSVVFGYRERAQQLNQGNGGANRVIFLPGDPNGNGGKIAPPIDVGRQDIFDDDVRIAQIRPLASWQRQFTISIWGWDPTDPMDELLQASAAEDLVEKTLQAIQSVKGGGPNVVPGATTWTATKERTLGAEVLLGCAFAHPLMDAPDEVVHPGFELKRHGIDDT